MARKPDPVIPDSPTPYPALVHVHGPDCHHDDDHQHGPAVETYRRETPKVGRNDPCSCGSGKKYKKCHGA
ncbi:MAG: SEC-C metal-binding domain-containing protein [Gammaproteobacteria bacterium]